MIVYLRRSLLLTLRYWCVSRLFESRGLMIRFMAWRELRRFGLWLGRRLLLSNWDVILPSWGIVMLHHCHWFAIRPLTLDNLVGQLQSARWVRSWLELLRPQVLIIFIRSQLTLFVIEICGEGILVQTCLITWMQALIIVDGWILQLLRHYPSIHRGRSLLKLLPMDGSSCISVLLTWRSHQLRGSSLCYSKGQGSLVLTLVHIILIHLGDLLLQHL